MNQLEEEKRRVETEIRQLQNRQKILLNKQHLEERKERNHRLCSRGGYAEGILPELITMPDEDAKAFLLHILTGKDARDFMQAQAEKQPAE